MAPKKRRQYGTGSVYQRTSDGRWFGKISAGWTTTGTRRYITVSAKTEAEAKRRLKDKQRDLARDVATTGRSTRTTVKGWSDEWLPIHVGQVRPNAYTTDAGAVRKWIVPTIGHRRLADLTPGDVRAVHKAVTGAGRKSTTARHAHWTLMGMLKAAALDGYTIPQAVLLVDAPSKAVHDRTAIPLPDALRLLEVIAKRPDAARWVTALLQAMRQGESLGLTREAVDLDRTATLPTGEQVPDPVLTISWQLQELPYLDVKAKAEGFRVPDGYDARQLHGAFHLTRPKSRAGWRVIPLVPWMANALRAELAKPQTNPWGLLWTDTDDRPGRGYVVPIRDTSDRARWKTIQDEAKVRHPSGRYYTLHEARHTTGTILLALNVPLETVKAIMGHSSAVTSQLYQHSDTTMTRGALEGVAGLLQLGGPQEG